MHIIIRYICHLYPGKSLKKIHFKKNSIQQLSFVTVDKPDKNSPFVWVYTAITKVMVTARSLNVFHS